MAQPSNLLLKLSRKLFPDPSQQTPFIQALTTPQKFPTGILWIKPKPAPLPFSIASPLPWQPAFVDRLSTATNHAKPGQHPLHEQGYFYCLDFSSVFAASVILSIPDSIQSIVDMCAAPGGKSLFAWAAHQPQQLICNEVIGKRKGALISNLKRCAIQDAIVLSQDSGVLAEKIPQTTDLVLVDAPCTGQSLLAKGDKAPGCFHPVSINKNASRQKRILANSAQLVAPQGYLAYMTCAYSIEENEQVSEWFLQRFPDFQAIEVPQLSKYRSTLTQLPGYRMFPQSGLGAGAFTILFRNRAIGSKQTIPAEFFNQPGLWKSQ